MSDQEQKTTKNLWFVSRRNQVKVSLSSYIQSKEKKLTEKEVFKEKWEVEDWIKKRKENFLNVLTSAIKKDPTTLIRMHANELKIHEKTVRTVIKQDLSPDRNLLDYVTWGVLEKKTQKKQKKQMQLPIQILVLLRVPFSRNGIKCLKNVILNACKSFRRRVDTITEKKYRHNE